MANFNRIENALNRSVYLGPLKSGQLKLDPTGIYKIFLSGNTSQRIFFIELEINYGKILVIKSNEEIKSNSTPWQTFGAELKSITTNNITAIYLAYSAANTTAFSGGDSTNYPIVYVEAIKEFVEVLPLGEVRNDIAATSNPNEFSFGKVYYLGEVALLEDAEVNGTNISAGNLDVSSVTFDNIYIRTSNNSAIYAPNIYVENVGFENVNTSQLNAGEIICNKIILRKSTDNSSNGWMIKADSSQQNNGTNIQILTLEEFNASQQQGS